MATVYATVRRAINTVLGKGDGSKLKALGHRTIELVASASGTIVDFKLRVPTNTRIDSLSRVYYDDLATSGAPTLDIGAYPVDANFTADPDAFNDGLTLATAITSQTAAPMVKDFANAGKQVWEYINGVTSDPGGFVDIMGVVKDAATTTTGTIALDVKAYDD